MKPVTTLVQAGTLAAVVAIAGCAQWNGNWNRTASAAPATKYPAGYPAASAAGIKNLPNGDVASARANGDATAADTRVRTSGPDNTSTVMAAQEALNRFGYNAGATDGTMTPATHDALQRFQTARGLPSTGNLDAATLSALGVPPRQ